MMTKYGDVPDSVVHNYFKSLINQIYKILPIKESGEQTLEIYIDSLLRELIGYKNLFDEVQEDSMLISIISILSYLSSNDCSTRVVRSDVFKAISICNKITERYDSKEV